MINPPAVNGVMMVREGRCMQREGAWTAVWAPISLATIAALLKKNKFEVKVIDCIVAKINKVGLKKIISDFKPSLVVINAITASIKSDLGVASLTKKISRDIKTAAFGIHVSALPKDSFILEPKLDYLIRGEPEITTLELAKTLLTNKKIDKVLGLSYKAGKKVVNNSDRPMIHNLNLLPPPAWELIDVTKYKMPFSAKPFLLVGIGRGCPYNCQFCADKAYYGQVLRLPSVRKVISEIERDIKEFGVDEFLFWTESFMINPKFAESVCREIIKRKLKIRFVVNGRVDQVNPKLLQLLKKAGCWMIGFGIESGDNHILELMQKGITTEQIKKAVIMAKKAGLEVTGHLIVGYPGETKATIEETIQMAIKLDLDFAQFYTSVPFPGSQLYLLAKKKNYIVNKNWTYFEQNFSVMNLPGLKAKEVETLRAEAYRRFYLRPKMIFKTLIRIRSLPEAFYFAKMARDFLNWF